jgi:glycosyltransferase involved in cell wall biosynthesis
MIDILLATYNGEKYIAEQLDSIINQTYKKWHLYIKDDCSTDNTLDIVKKYQDDYPTKITVISSGTRSGSAKNNFFSMLGISKSPYVMFCDQDDIWLPDKIKITHRRMLMIEKKYGNSIPILVHTDMCVVDDNLRVIHNSKIAYDGINRKIKYQNFRNTLFENTVSGCNMEVNRALLENVKVENINDVKDVYMHDWWMALYAKAFGKISCVNKPTMLYRLHGDNTCGIVPKMTPITLVKRLFLAKYRQEGKDSMQELNRMYRTFYLMNESKLEKGLKDDLRRFIDSFESNKLIKWYTVLKCRFKSLRPRTYIFYLVFC